MARMERQLANRLEQQGVRVLAVNLYDLSIELLQQRGHLGTSAPDRICSRCWRCCSRTA